MTTKQTRISYILGMLGRNMVKTTCNAHTTLEQLRDRKKLRNFEIRINNKRRRNNYVIHENDIIIAIPNALVMG